MDEAEDERDGGLDRMTMFSDGVFAIAITLLVLPLTDTEIDGDRVAEGLLALAPGMLTFALSFAVIGRYWVLHHHVFERMARADGGLIALNLVYLFGIAFLPFPTSVLGEHGDGTAATVLYAVNLIAVSTTAFVLWWYVSRHRRLLRTSVTPWEIRIRLARSGAPILALLPSLPLAYLSPDWAKLSWLLLIPVSMAADRLFPDTPPS